MVALENMRGARAKRAKGVRRSVRSGSLPGAAPVALLAALLLVLSLAGCGAAAQKDDGVRDMAVDGASASELSIAEMFPDAGVAAAVSAQLDTDNSGGLSDAEIQAAQVLNIQNADEVSGLGRVLTQLITLTVSGNARVVDVTDVSSLISLDVSDTDIVKLDLSLNSHLATLRVIGCDDLQVVNLNGDDALRELDFSSCKSLRGVDVTGCTALSSLKAFDRVVFNGLEDTQLQERWLVTDFRWKRPALAGAAAQECGAQAEYDKNGRLVRLTTSGFADVSNGTRSFTYDEQGRLDTVTEGAGSAAHLVYESDGRLQRIEGSGAASFSYNADNMLVKTEMNKSPYQVAYSYNDEGQVTSVSAGDGRGELAYGSAGLTGIANAAGSGSAPSAFETSYNAEGKPEAVTLVFDDMGTGAQAFVYDDHGVLTDLAQQRAGGTDRSQPACPTVMSTSFLYDDHGNLTAWEPMYAEDGVSAGEGSIAYTRVFLAKDSTQARQDFLFAANPLAPRVLPAFYSPTVAMDADLLAYTNGLPDSEFWMPRAEPAEVAKMMAALNSEEEGDQLEEEDAPEGVGVVVVDGQPITSDDEPQDAASLAAAAAQGDAGAEGDAVEGPEPDEQTPDVDAQVDADTRPSTSDGDYVLPDSDTHPYTAAELEALSDHELLLARNEIFARHGRQFTSNELKDYFESKPWYNGTISPEEFDSSMGSTLNEVERANIVAIQAIERSRG